MSNDCIIICHSQVPWSQCSSPIVYFCIPGRFIWAFFIGNACHLVIHHPCSAWVILECQVWKRDGLQPKICILHACMHNACPCPSKRIHVHFLFPFHFKHLSQFACNLTRLLDNKDAVSINEEAKLPDRVSFDGADGQICCFILTSHPCSNILVGMLAAAWPAVMCSSSSFTWYHSCGAICAILWWRWPLSMNHTKESDSVNKIFWTTGTAGE